jgi:hypothetical protein
MVENTVGFGAAQARSDDDLQSLREHDSVQIESRRDG